MSNNSTIKYWNDDEETKLINEINNLTDINEILENHNRKITGILIRIEKLLNDPIKSVKIFNKNEIFEKYLANTKNKIFICYDELYTNILNFNSIEEISNKYNKLSHTKIKKILNDFLKKKDIGISEKLRIKCLLKDNDEFEFAEKVFSNNNINDNYINSNNESNINSIVISLLEEMKIIKTDVFDIKNRVKIIMDKINNIDKNKELKINNKDILNKKQELQEKEQKVEEEQKSHKKTSKKKIKKTKKKDLNINKHVEKIILSNNDEITSKNNYDDNKDLDDEELEKELKKMLN